MKTEIEEAASEKLEIAPWPYFAPDEISAVVKCMESGKVNYWTGTEGLEFEKEFAEFCGAKYAVAVANGTLALELALKVLGVSAGDEVITASRTFIASASCAVAVGAVPRIADVDRNSQNVTVETIDRAVTPRTKAIVAVHLAGWPCDMPAIMDYAKTKGLFVIEDCAQAHGAEIDGRPVGSFGDTSAFSFCQDKIMTTLGDGGMFVTNNEEAFEKGWSYKDHGKERRLARQPSPAPGFRWLHKTFGSNWRLTEPQSAVGRVQLRKLKDWVATRRSHAQIYLQALSDVACIRVPQPRPGIEHSYYKFYGFAIPERFKQGWSRDRIVKEISSAGVPCFTGSCSEIYLEEAFPAEWRPKARLPIAKELGESSLMFLLHPTLTEKTVRHFAKVIREVLQTAST